MKKILVKYILSVVVAGFMLPLGSCDVSSQTKRITDMIEVPAYSSDRAEQVIFHKAYTVSYNRDHKIPNWVAWELTSKHTTGPIKRTDSFAPDPLVRAGDYCPTQYDYKYHETGYTRGHMCPAMDNKWDSQAMEECFYMTNICPQTDALNGGLWENLEQKCHSWANEFGEVYIVCGPIIPEHVTKQISDHQITVPDSFFKIVLRINGDEAKAVGFIFTQENTQKSESVDAIEKMTGLDFFHNLPENIQTKVEAENNSSLD